MGQIINLVNWFFVSAIFLAIHHRKGKILYTRIFEKFENRYAISN